ncbi:MAG: hypothetical protein JWM35_380 [Verrucomicrobia bacterium]|nr:hypothetical protein [Verrucomicrobiota bacterium]
MKTPSTKFWIVVSFLLLSAAAQAAVLRFHADLSGANESPVNNSTSTGVADVYFDVDNHTLQVNITFSGVTSLTTAAHIHAPGTAATILSAIPFTGAWAVATQPTNFTGFPLGVSSGTYVGAAYSLQATANYTPGYLSANGATAAAAETALLNYMLSGKTYLNIHSTSFPGGELRGFLQYVTAPGAGKFVNVSSRAQVGTGDGVLIAGFVVTGTTPRTVLVRAIGPTLGTYGVTGVLADPQLDVSQSVNGVNVPVVSVDDWGGVAQISAAAVAVGAFPFASATSKDAAVLVTLQPGVYSAKVSGVGNTTGNALLEVYEVP